ncbi:MAG: hypothetical protein JXB14_04215 [Candidatus Altiarchaeota archaeon]|nr:hypothetical protein [Candidatus Altiarchaeota archaeon]
MPPGKRPLDAKARSLKKLRNASRGILRAIESGRRAPHGPFLGLERGRAAHILRYEMGVKDSSIIRRVQQEVSRRYKKPTEEERIARFAKALLDVEKHGSRMANVVQDGRIDGIDTIFRERIRGVLGANGGERFWKHFKSKRYY